ncbi:MAG: hypothetical protein Kow0065_02920 [Methylomicrobium sp.]
MYNERRNHPRLSIRGLKAYINIDRLSQDSIEIEGQVVDISYTGIKISLTSPLPEKSEGIVKIVILLPESNIPLTIHGKIRHFCPRSGYGIHFNESTAEEDLDEFMFECVKLPGAHSDSMSLC